MVWWASFKLVNRQRKTVLVSGVPNLKIPNFNMTTFFIIALLIQPWILIPNANVVDQMRLPQSIFLDFIFMGIITYSFYIGQRFIYRNKYLSLLVGWVFLNFIIYFFVPFAMCFKDSGRMINIVMLEPMIHIFLALWASYIVLSNFDKEDFVRVAKALCVSGTLVASFAILQFTGFDPLKTIAHYNCVNRVSACLDNPNLVGNYLVLCLPLFFMFKNLKYTLCSFIVIGGIAVTRYHFGMFLAILSLLLYFGITYRRNKWVLGGILLMILLGGILIKFTHFIKLYNGMSGRFDCWKIAIIHFKDNVIFGQGIGIWKAFNVFTGAGYTMWTCVHNDWIERAVEIGIIGVFLILLVVINSIRNFRFEDEVGTGYFTTFIIFLLMAIGSFPLETATIALPGLISWWAVERL